VPASTGSVALRPLLPVRVVSGACRDRDVVLQAVANPTSKW